MMEDGHAFLHLNATIRANRDTKVETQMLRNKCCVTNVAKQMLRYESCEAKIFQIIKSLKIFKNSFENKWNLLQEN